MKKKTQMNVKVSRLKNPKDKTRTQISFTFEFGADDPQAERIYRGIGLCIKEALTPAETEEFLGQLDVHREKLRTKLRKGLKKVEE